MVFAIRLTINHGDWLSKRYKLLNEYCIRNKTIHYPWNIIGRYKQITYLVTMVFEIYKKRVPVKYGIKIQTNSSWSKYGIRNMTN